MYRLVLGALLASLLSTVIASAQGVGSANTSDCVVYGGTPAGIAAAISVADQGHGVILVEPYSHVGGLVTNGLSHADFRTFEGLTGTFLEFNKRIESHYLKQYGPAAPQTKSWQGTHAEPHVNLLVFRQMLAEHEQIEVLTEFELESVELASDSKRTISTVSFVGANGQTRKLSAKVFIDATYEGDLMAAAGVRYRLGREARSEYHESQAPVDTDDQLQGYNFRLCMTREKANQVMPTKPAGYDREDYLDILPLLSEGKLKRIFCAPSGGVYKYQPPALPNGKYDINDVSHGLARLSLPNINNAWPEGDRATRQDILAQHLRHNVGLLYFLQNDAAVPEQFQADARQWGLCRDEFVDTDHLPEQLYVREARRMVGQHVFTENDTNYAPGDARSRLHTESIAMGDYGPNCHGTHHVGSRFGGRHTGEFYKKVAPYQIPYGVLVPREIDNLLVPVACSASHVGFCALRLEPIWASLGQAAGVAASLAVRDGATVSQVPVREVQRILHAKGAATIYVSDCLPDSPHFAAVQWWGSLGGLHGLAKTPAQAGQRGEHLFGQYFHAFPHHAVEWNQPLAPAVRAAWLKLAQAEQLDPAALRDAATRGDFIGKAYALQRQVVRE